MRKRRNYVNNHAKKSQNEQADIRNLFRLFVSIKTAEGVSDGTLRQYENNFGYFCDYLKTVEHSYEVSEVTAELIREWIMHMQSEHVQFSKVNTRQVKNVGLAPSTINTRLKTMRVMFNTLVRQRKVDSSPITLISNVYEPEEEISVLSDVEVSRLLGVMDKSYYTDYRDYVLTELLLDTMMRITEALTLVRSDIDRELSVIKIRASVAKNRKARAVPVSGRTLRLLDELMRENDNEFYSEFIFATSEDNHYDRNKYNQRLKDYAEIAGIEKSIHAHLFRHTTATRWLERGGGMEELRLILGHSKYEMVKRYAHVSSKALTKAAAKYGYNSDK